jgi:hypothetical protein
MIFFNVVLHIEFSCRSFIIFFLVLADAIAGIAHSTTRCYDDGESFYRFSSLVQKSYAMMIGAVTQLCFKVKLTCFIYFIYIYIYISYNNFN